MRLPARLDTFVERALLGTLDHPRRKLLNSLLGLNAAAGIVVALGHPELAELTLLFPCIVLAFFGGSAWFNVVWLLLFAQLRPRLLEVGAFTLAVAVGTLFAHITAERYRQSRNRQLELEKAVDLARRRQQQLEPPPCQVLQGRLEVACSMQVCRQLGGDFLCVKVLAPDRISLLLGDVMGKGLPAGLVAVYMEGVYHQLADRALEPAALLTELNRSLVHFDPVDPLFATAICLEADFERKVWKVARAGHERLLFLPGRSFDDPPHLPLGLQDDLQFQQECLPLELGDCVLLVSDGVTDRLGALEDLGLTAGPSAAALASLVNQLGIALEDDATLAWVRVQA